jgi:hypothetical protein
VTGHYLLGNGYRAFNPVLMRFNSPDNLSPFGKGGLNSYAYCLGDPINLQDSTGAAALPKLLSRAFEGILKSLGRTGHTYRKGSAKLFSSVTTTTTSKSNTFTYSDSPYMGRRHSAPSDSAKAPSPEEFAKWDLIGNHGTSKHNTDRLIAGLDPSFIGSKNGLFRGRGFYTTPDYDRAMGYASNAIQPHPPQVFGVYVKNFSSLKPGIDYTFHTHSHRRNNLEVVLREPAYSSVQIRAIDKQRKVVLPRPNEAPF